MRLRLEWQEKHYHLENLTTDIHGQPMGVQQAMDRAFATCGLGNRYGIIPESVKFMIEEDS